MSFASYEEHAYQGQPVELYKFTKGVVDYHYTSADVDIDYLGDTYEAQPGLSRSNFKQSTEGRANEVGLTLPHDHTIPLLFKSGLPHEEVSLVVYKKHRADSDFVHSWKGNVVECSFNYPHARLSCLPLDGQKNNPVLQPTYQNRCNWKIYDQNCGLDFDSWAVSMTVAAISSNGQVITVGDLSSYAADYFKGGVIRFGTASHVMVTGHTVSGGSDTINIFQALVGLAVGDVIKVAPACMGDRATCNSRFSNGDNNFGFKIPTKNIFAGDGFNGDI